MFFLIFFTKAYVVDTHLNCLDLLRQVEAVQMSTNNICFYKEVDKNMLVVIYTTKLLDCALIGAFAVIKLTTVISLFLHKKIYHA